MTDTIPESIHDYHKWLEDLKKKGQDTPLAGLEKALLDLTETQVEAIRNRRKYD